MSATTNDAGEPPDLHNPMQQNCPLLRLPAELRNAIYAHACTHAQVQYWRSKREFQTSFTPDNTFGLRLACKQLYHEVPLNPHTCKHLKANGVPNYLLNEYWSTAEEIKADQIESIVVVRKPRAFRIHDFHFVKDLLRTWPALRYLEIQGAFIWVDRRCLNGVQVSMPYADLEVCFKYDNNASEWRFDCRARTFVMRTDLTSSSG
ncbi:hypothetical protein G6514_000962 [Epicoccum nigrum]|nr:hypothetical protein G6514_000962 [Epicoccum nigrum]